MTPKIESVDGRPQVSVPSYSAVDVNVFLLALQSVWDAESTVFEIVKAGGWMLDTSDPSRASETDAGHRLLIDSAHVGDVVMSYGSDVTSVTLGVGATWLSVQAIVRTFEAAEALVDARREAARTAAAEESEEPPAS